MKVVKEAVMTDKEFAAKYGQAWVGDRQKLRAKGWNVQAARLGEYENGQVVTVAGKQVRVMAAEKAGGVVVEYAGFSTDRSECGLVRWRTDGLRYYSVVDGQDKHVAGFWNERGTAEQVARETGGKVREQETLGA